jgi:hypothetical protein
MAHPLDLRVRYTEADRRQVWAFVDELLRMKPADALRAAGTRAGKLGEVAFSKVFGHPVDWGVRLGGDDGIDFTLDDGTTVDVKSIKVAANMNFNYQLPIDLAKAHCTYYVQVLVAPDWDYGLITGGTSLAQFKRRAQAVVWARDRRAQLPTAIPRRLLSHDWPAMFWALEALRALAHD